MGRGGDQRLAFRRAGALYEDHPGVGSYQAGNLGANQWVVVRPLNSESGEHRDAEGGGGSIDAFDDQQVITAVEHGAQYFEIAAIPEGGGITLAQLGASIPRIASWSASEVGVAHRPN